MKLAHEDHGRLVSRHARRNSDYVTDLGSHSLGIPRSSCPRTMKRQKKGSNEIPEHYQTVPSQSSAPPNGIPAFMRSNSSGSMKRPLSFIAGIASKVKNAFEGWQDSSSNRQSGKWSFNGTENESSSESPSPNAPRKSLNTYPRSKKPKEKLPSPEQRPWPSGGRSTSTRKSNSFKPLNPSFAEVMEILSVPSSPELESSPLRDALSESRTLHLDSSCDVTIDQPNDIIRPKDITKSGDVHVLVIGSEGVGKSALIVRYVTKRFIGEYASNVESIYDHLITVDGKEVLIHFWDSGIPTMLQKTPETGSENSPSFDLPDILATTSIHTSVRSSDSSTSSIYDNRVSISSYEEDFTMTSFPANSNKKTTRQKKRGKKEVNNNFNKKANEMEVRLDWCDCIVIVYSICDVDSFEAARDVVRYIRGQYVRGHAVSEFERGSRRSSGSIESPDSDPAARLAQIPILLVGNKADLQHRRCVDTSAATLFSQGYGCSSAELSVTEGFEPVSRVFNNVVEMIHRDKLPSKMTKIKSIMKSVSGGFSHSRNMSM